MSATDEITTEGGRFSAPAPLPPARAEAIRQAQRREDDPPPEVPRDQYERPIIVLPDGSGCLSYLRASKLGKVTRGRNLIKWDERNIVYGMSRGHHLVVRAQGVRTLTARPDLAVLEDVADKAKIIAGADAGAMTGSGMHALHARRVAGEDLSWLDPTTLGCLDAITALLDPRIFEIIVTEGDDDLGRTFVVHDALRAAGSFDLVVRLRADLTWPDGVTIEAGTILVVDLKTGKITSGPYWGMEFTGQQLVYAEGTPYRPGTTHLANPQVRSVKNVTSVTAQPGAHGRIGWAAIGVPERPCQRWSLILHVPALSPGDAHWERVDLDQAREDARACRGVWDRDRVGRAERFLALPAAALVLPDPTGPGVDLPPTGSAPVDTDVSPSSSGSIMDSPNARLRATLRERISRCDTTDKVDALYDAWGQSPTWDDVLTAACQEVYDRLTPPRDRDEDAAVCDACDYDRHACPGCGRGVAHGVAVCPACSLRVALDEAPDRAAIALLWDAHGPDGDDIWTGEHQAAGKARYAALPACDNWPDLDTGETTDEVDAAETELIEALDNVEAAQGGGPHVPPEATTAYPCTVGTAELAVTLWCHECLVPPGHPDADDPIAWCDCGPGETCLDAATACRNRAHDPAECHRRPTYPHHEGYDGGDVPDEVFRGPDHDPAGPPPEPGPFDRTMDLSDLRDLIEQALDTETLDDLYDAHGPVSEGGDGLWTDDLNAPAQAAYDRLSGQEQGAGTSGTGDGS
jgi:hypothetical protein